MRDTSLSPLERECWRLRSVCRDYRKIGERLGISGDHAKYETYGAEAKLIRQWQIKLPRLVLRRVLARKGK
jgi:hypothetical protein